MSKFLSLGYNTVKSGESYPAFQENISSASSRLKSKPSKSLCCLLHVACLLALCFSHWRWMRHVTPKCLLAFSVLQSVLSLFMTVMRTSDPMFSSGWWHGHFVLCLTFAHFGNLGQWKFCAKERKRVLKWCLYIVRLLVSLAGLLFRQKHLTRKSMSQILV
jgi:hypothetical protein